MKSLVASTILQHLTREKQKELYKLLHDELYIDKSLKNMYMVEYWYSCPTGGDWCDHDRPYLITGSYSEAKEFFDNISNKYGKELTDNDHSPLIESYRLFHGQTVLEKISIDHINLKIFKENYGSDNTIYPRVQLDSSELTKQVVKPVYPNYELTYPLFDVRFEGNYDTKTSLGIYDNFESAIHLYINKTREYALSKDHYHLHYGITLTIIQIDKNYKFTHEYIDELKNTSIIMKSERCPAND
ncbi:MAG: hypothetical protein Barrevirus14_3 [Barrevirus sp.]|uniref:Uncharacterized protein n=1 Tax=Barrevirus sp. TaxID=2487763 RepID=A0A3G4ZS43_9VIRU|nr:MAG: hypothetical protein Barrevirus14_3 [Barrevirus sp.]